MSNNSLAGLIIAILCGKEGVFGDLDKDIEHAENLLDKILDNSWEKAKKVNAFNNDVPHDMIHIAEGIMKRDEDDDGSQGQ